MNSLKKLMEENPLARVYLTILPALAAAIVLIFAAVKLISGIFAPDQLVVDITYRDYEEGSVMKTPIRVAKDAAFEEEIKNMADRKSGFMDILVILEKTAEKSEELAELDALEEPVEEEKPEDGTYTFAFENTKLPDTIYMKTPEWWSAINTEGSMEFPLEIGSAVNVPELQGFESSEAAEFQITNVETTKISTGIFNVTVTLTSEKEVTPSKVRLIMGDEIFEEWDGTTEVSYNADTGFVDRTLVFRYNRSLRDDISDLIAEAVVSVDECTVRKVFTDAVITTNIKGLNIVPIGNK